MPIAIDSISKRKLVLVRQLYQLALNQSQLHYSTINRITAVIGFDLAVETLLKVVVAVLDHTKPPADQFNGLLDQSEKLLGGHSLPPLPHRAQILHIHSLRNDAQHKARYPNESDISDCRTYARDFCRDLILNVWGEAFDQLSPIDLVDDALIRELLQKSQDYISRDDYKKSIAFAENTFHWASLAIFAVMPRSTVRILNERRTQFGTLVQDINGAIVAATSDATYYAALFSSGVNLISYKRYKDIAPVTEYSGESQITPTGTIRSKSIRIFWNGRNPSKEDALWMHDFAVNSIVNWQSTGLQPKIEGERTEWAQLLLNFGPEIHEFA